MNCMSRKVRQAKERAADRERENAAGRERKKESGDTRARIRLGMQMITAAMSVTAFAKNLYGNNK